MPVLHLLKFCTVVILPAFSRLLPCPALPCSSSQCLISLPGAAPGLQALTQLPYLTSELPASAAPSQPIAFLSWEKDNAIGGWFQAVWLQSTSKPCALSSHQKEGLLTTIITGCPAPCTTFTFPQNCFLSLVGGLAVWRLGMTFLLSNTWNPSYSTFSSSQRKRPCSPDV